MLFWGRNGLRVQDLIQEKGPTTTTPTAKTILYSTISVFLVLCYIA